MIGLLRWCARLGGVGALLVGLMLGRFPLFHLHMALGGLVALALLILAFAALASKVRPPAAIAGIVWAIVLVYVGLMQNRWMPGGSHWIIELVHALIGIGGVGLAEMLAGALTRRPFV